LFLNINNYQTSNTNSHLKINNLTLSKNLVFFTIIVLLRYAILIVSQYFTTETILLNTFESSEFVEKIITQQREYAWLSYLLIPLLCGLKILLISVTLNIGMILLELKISFSALIRIVLKAEIIPITFTLILFLFIFQRDFNTLDEISAFNPFSLVGYINTENIPGFLMYPLTLINLGEFFYWIILALLLKNILKKSFLYCLGFIAKTYGLGLLIWVSIIVFLIINING
jgi:hypothetical protein